MRLPTLLRCALATGILLAGVTVGVAAPVQAETAPKRIASGWMPYWMTSPARPAGVNSAVQNADLFVDVSPFWYSAMSKSGGGVQVKLNPNFTNGAANAAWAMGQLKGAGLTVLPAIADSSGKGKMAKTLADPALRASHIADIVALVTSNGYDGIDLDYEAFAFSDGSSTWAATQPNWTAFVTELGAALHAQGKQLTVTIPPPCNTSGACGPKSGYWVYNMTGIAPAVDRIRIMAYDYHVNGIGAIAPMPWVRTIAQYAATAIDPAKVQIGVPTYGRAWTRKNSDGSYKLSGTCPAPGTKDYTSLTAMASITDADVPATLAKLGVQDQVQWSDTEQENWVNYDKKVTWTDSGGASQTCTANRVMWWVDPRGVLARTQLVGEFGLNSAAYWTIGGDDPSQWPLIRSYAQSLAPVGIDVTAAAPPAVAFGQPITITSTVSAAGAPIAGAQAVLQFTAEGSKKAVDIQSAATGADGSVVFTVTPETSGSWQVVVPPADARVEGASAPVVTAVVSTVSAKMKSPSSKPGAPVKVKVVARPALSGQKVLLQLKKGEQWSTIGTAKANAKGRVTVSGTAPKAKGTYTLRVATVPKAGIREGLSADLRLRVRK